MSNQIAVIHPYYWNGIWVFDDPAVGLVKEALVGGMPEIIVEATRQFGINNPQAGFTVVFSKDAFPDEQIVMQWVKHEANGNVYRWTNPAGWHMEGWLCPALFRYFDEVPKEIHIQLKQADTKQFDEWFDFHFDSRMPFNKQALKDLARSAWNAGRQSNV